MNKVDFNQFYQNIESGVEGLAKSTLQNYLSQAKTDGKNAVKDMKGYLQQWTVEVEEGALTIEDLEFLLKEEAALTEMTTLKEAGLAAVRIDEFKTGITNMITGAIAGLVRV